MLAPISHLPTTLEEAHEVIVRQQERIAELEKQVARVAVLEQQVETLQKVSVHAILSGF